MTNQDDDDDGDDWADTDQWDDDDYDEFVNREFSDNSSSTGLSPIWRGTAWVLLGVFFLLSLVWALSR